jgi:hypothetical protein
VGALHFPRSDLRPLALRTTTHNSNEQLTDSLLSFFLFEAWPAAPKEDRSRNLNLCTAVVFGKSPPLDLMELTLLLAMQECPPDIPISQLSSLGSGLTMDIL